VKPPSLPATGAGSHRPHSNWTSCQNLPQTNSARPGANWLASLQLFITHRMNEKHCSRWEAGPESIGPLKNDRRLVNSQAAIKYFSILRQSAL
jgi:hypothetical protein